MALDLTDKTANGNALTNHNSVSDVTTSLPSITGTTHAAGFALASSQYLTAADSASLSITGSLTLEGWFKFSSTLVSNGDTYKLINKSEDVASEHRAFMFFLTNAAGTIKLDFIMSPDGTYNGSNDISVAWTPSTGTWYHLAVTFNTSTKDVKFYVDGSQQGSTGTTNDATIENNAISFQIGATNADNTPKHFLDGVVDEVRVWNVVRTSTEINNNKGIRMTGSESGLVAYYPFEALPSLGGYIFIQS